MNIRRSMLCTHVVGLTFETQWWVVPDVELFRRPAVYSAYLFLRCGALVLGCVKKVEGVEQDQVEERRRAVLFCCLEQYYMREHLGSLPL